MPADRDEIDLRAQLDGLDRAVYRAIAATPTPGLDRQLTRLSRAANHSGASWAGDSEPMWCMCISALGSRRASRVRSSSGSMGRRR
jgi:hypothetical protein